ncbi:XdhC family protein [Streptomyces europaeiscabiei]|uniref:XdhC family protein n=1 Tax=Streptomyces europaeiscabiei TaxID=146819 RepID=UPI0038D4AFCC
MRAPWGCPSPRRETCAPPWKRPPPRLAVSPAGAAAGLPDPLGRTSPTLNIADTLYRWRREARSFTLATVIEVSGSAPLPPGTALAVDTLVAAALARLDVAATGWVACEGKVPLAVLLDRAMGAFAE